jgi:uncharacterized membrane protein YfhO
MVYDALIVAPENVQKTMEKGSIDYRRTVVIEKQPGVQLPKLQPDEVQHNIECIRYANNDLTYRITTGKPGVLCLSEIWYPAWKAAVDGVETEVLRSNYSLRAVAVPAGTHTVALHYDSNTFSVGRWTTILTLAVVVAGLFWTRRRQNRP